MDNADFPSLDHEQTEKILQFQVSLVHLFHNPQCSVPCDVPSTSLKLIISILSGHFISWVQVTMISVVGKFYRSLFGSSSYWVINARYPTEKSAIAFHQLAVHS